MSDLILTAVYDDKKVRKVAQISVNSGGFIKHAKGVLTFIKGVHKPYFLEKLKRCYFFDDEKILDDYELGGELMEPAKTFFSRDIGSKILGEILFNDYEIIPLFDHYDCVNKADYSFVLDLADETITILKKGVVLGKETFEDVNKGDTKLFNGFFKK